MKSIMNMILTAIFAQVFALKLRQVNPQLRLFADLQMTDAQKVRLEGLIAEYFDGLNVECDSTTTLGDIYACVVNGLEKSPTRTA